MFRITAERSAKGWTKAELARRAKMQAGDLGRIESGRAAPYPVQLRKLARALGIGADNASSLMEQVDSPEARS